MKSFKVTANGFIKYFDGSVIHTFFYNPDSVKDLIKEGVKQVF